MTKNQDIYFVLCSKKENIVLIHPSIHHITHFVPYVTVLLGSTHTPLTTSQNMHVSGLEITQTTRPRTGFRTGDLLDNH